MKIELLNLSCENFKGLKEFSENFDGANAKITAANGVGKTTVYDMFLWLLFGKDSTGRTDSGKGKFEVRPLESLFERHGASHIPVCSFPIKGLEVMVQATLRIDGIEHTFKRVQKENVVKHQLRGYSTDYWIDGVPKQEKDYKPIIAELIDEDRFKVLTDLSHFNAKVHWTARRRLLLDIAGDVGTPAGFETLVKSLSGKTIKELEDVLKQEKKGYEKERDEINPRIDEIHKGLADYVAEDTDKLQEQRKGVEQTIEGLDGERTKLLSQETQRQAKIDEVNKLNCQRLERETELKNDTSGTKALRDEKEHLDEPASALRKIVADVSGAIELNESMITTKENELASHMETLQSIRAEYTKASSAPIADICYACDQKLPHEKLSENAANRQAALAAITERGNNIKDLAVRAKRDLEHFRNNHKDIEHQRDTAEAKLEEAEHVRDVRLAEIDQLIASNPKIRPEDDGNWQDICAEIKKLEGEIGPPAAEQLETIETNRKAAQDVLDKLNESLAQADRIKADRGRISDYELREKELAQLVADLEKQISEIGEYKAEVSRRIQAAVNDKFKYVEFKMFEQQLNGEFVDCCEATFGGVPYADMSTGQKIICGVDVINVLSEHYVVSVPLFVDHAESLTLPLEAKSQTIELYAEEGVDELQVEIKAKERTAAA